MNTDAKFASGRFSSERRPPLRGCTQKYVFNPKWPSTYESVAVDPPPTLPTCRDLCKNRGKLPPVQPPALKVMDVGSGHAHGRARAAHMGLEGVPGTRWA